MDEIILDSIRDLLKRGKGDPRLLEQIKRAAEQDEVISVYERDYVNGLTERYLKPGYNEGDVWPIQKPDTSTWPVSRPQRAYDKRRSRIPIKRLFALWPRRKLTKAISGIVIIALVAAIATVYLPSDLEPDRAVVPPKITVQKPTLASGLTVETDSLSYSLGDILSVSGTSDAGGDVTLSITNSADQLVWQETVALKSDGTYSTLSIAGGQGWESAGSYTLKAQQGSLVAEFSFDFG